MQDTAFSTRYVKSFVSWSIEKTVEYLALLAYYVPVQGWKRWTSEFFIHIELSASVQLDWEGLLWLKFKWNFPAHFVYGRSFHSH